MPQDHSNLHCLISLKAERAIFSLNDKHKINKLPVKITLDVFQSCIQPILTYGSEVWSPYSNFDHGKWDICSIETVELWFIKHTLGEHTSAPNNLVRGELGQSPLKSFIDFKSAEFYKYLSK